MLCGFSLASLPGKANDVKATGRKLAELFRSNFSNTKTKQRVMIGDVHFGVTFFEGRRIFERRVASLVPRFLPRKTGREPGRSDYVRYVWFCVWF